MAASFARARRAAPWLCATALPCMLVVGCSGGSHVSPTGSGSVSTPVLNPPQTTPPSDAVTPPPASSSGSATDTVLSLSWRANIDVISGYKVYYGPTPESATTLAADLPLGANGFNAAAPGVSFNAGSDLHLSQGNSVCFRLRAYDAANVMSDWSQAVCNTI